MRTGLRRDLAKLALLFGGFLNGPQLILGMGKIQAFGVGNELGMLAWPQWWNFEDKSQLEVYFHSKISSR